MAENVITNADDVELILQADGTKRGTTGSLGRIVVDEFSITKEEDDTLESGVGQHLPVGISEGDVTHQFSFTLLGEDVQVFEMVAGQSGRSNIFSFTAQKREDDGTVRWQFSLDTCKATSEEISGSSGDTMEYAVDGIAVRVDKQGTRETGGAAWG